jgi:hypothetical protein
MIAIFLRAPMHNAYVCGRGTVTNAHCLLIAAFQEPNILEGTRLYRLPKSFLAAFIYTLVFGQTCFALESM